MVPEPPILCKVLSKLTPRQLRLYPELYPPVDRFSQRARESPGISAHGTRALPPSTPKAFPLRRVRNV